MTVELPARVRERWPPRSRTERYRLIRTAPSTGWAVASGRWKCRSSRRLSPHGFSRPVAAPAAHLPTKRAAVPSRNALTSSRFRGGARDPGGFTLLGAALLPGVNGQEMAEDGELESQRFRAHPVSGRGQPAWLVHPPRAEGGGNDPHGFTRAPLSGRARLPAGSPSM
jgi:hypothetical protein